ncbi:MAG: LTA synthase family protein [Desulfovibrio sp.]|nr:LTA synthase family protein [Desulfovibrio sp.]
MAVDSTLHTAGMGLLGLALSVGAEGLLRPRPSLQRPAQAWVVHVALWFVVYALLVLLSGRAWCSMTGAFAIIMMLVLVSNAKYTSLREPFLVQDYDYFLDAVRYPRLFLPFLGVKGFLGAAAFFVLALVGLWLERPLSHTWPEQTSLVAILLAALFLLWRLRQHDWLLTFAPEADLRRLGLLAYFWAYGTALMQPPAALSPFAGRAKPAHRHELPHLVAIQSESFFDARSLYTGIRPEVLTAFDALIAQSVLHGPLTVPAWGANTVRTEFAFLTGITAQGMGAHAFNPYRPVISSWSVHSLPLFLQALGYRTICVHPHHAGFYGRDKALPRLGFDSFTDIHAFAHARREGAYVADAALAEHIGQILQTADRPTFVFAITMENHGPLHLERPQPGDAERLYHTPPPEGCDELTVYLRHLRNADAMFGALAKTMDALQRPASLCIYGDHVPIMPQAYSVLHPPAGTVPYACWQNQYVPEADIQGTAQPLAAHELAMTWLDSFRFFHLHP